MRVYIDRFCIVAKRTLTIICNYPYDKGFSFVNNRNDWGL